MKDATGLECQQKSHSCAISFTFTILQTLLLKEVEQVEGTMLQKEVFQHKITYSVTAEKLG